MRREAIGEAAIVAKIRYAALLLVPAFVPSPAPASAHDLVVGAGLRTTRDEFINNLNAFRLDPPRNDMVMNAFVQDRIAIAPEPALILGINAERTGFAGFELLPNRRVAWQPDEWALPWCAVSRAVFTSEKLVTMRRATTSSAASSPPVACSSGRA